MKCKDAWTVDKTITVYAAHEHYDLMKKLDPSMFAFNAVAHNYVVAEQLAMQPELLIMPEQHQVTTKLTLQSLGSDDQSNFDACENGHTSEALLKHILQCSILLKNFCGKLNDKLLDAADKSKKRKATTLHNKYLKHKMKLDSRNAVSFCT
ncbi:hypothetical protein HPB50_006769 [Hyalomma asiaticum]|uniref:Uncharacterized protein n=1 Tax=Hyalomma asiaticum TaxID=266040 RepID=A0ACB7SK80_HYAAI|nr:hypothetical protein HPB50_006769 [Hyalomma asiaticum]